MSAPLRLREIAKQQGLTIEQLLEQAIEKAGSITKAAGVLGVNPNTLKYNLRVRGMRVVQITKVVRIA